VEQEHRFIKQLTEPGIRFASLTQHEELSKGLKQLVMIRKEQVQDVEKGDVKAQVEFACQLFGIA